MDAPLVTGSGLAREAHQGAEFRDSACLGGRCHLRFRRPVAQIPHRHHLSFAHLRRLHNAGQLPVSCMAGSRNPAMLRIREICGQGQYLARRDARPVCHLAPQVAPQEAQYLRSADCLFRYHRLRWVGRCRGTYRLHRKRHRVEHRAGFPPVAQDSHDIGRMRRGGRYRRCVPRSHRRDAFHSRSAHARPLRSHRHATADIFNFRRYGGLRASSRRPNLTPRPRYLILFC